MVCKFGSAAGLTYTSNVCVASIHTVRLAKTTYLWFHSFGKQAAEVCLRPNLRPYCQLAADCVSGTLQAKKICSLPSDLLQKARHDTLSRYWSLTACAQNFAHRYRKLKAAGALTKLIAFVRITVTVSAHTLRA